MPGDTGQLVLSIDSGGVVPPPPHTQSPISISVVIIVMID